MGVFASPTGHLLLITAVIAITALQPTETSSVPVHPCTNSGEWLGCPVTEQEAQAFLAPCLRMGEKFLKRFIRRFNRDPLEEQCEEFVDVQYRLRVVLEICPWVAQVIPEEWLSTIDMLTCTCNQNHPTHAECAASLVCMESELHMLFAANCENKFVFNLAQHTQSKCHFRHEYVRCRQQLVESACGRNAGNLAFLSDALEASREDCALRRQDIPAFSYSELCPVDLPAQLETCLDSTLTSVLTFRFENVLITADSPQHAAEACREFSDYWACLDGWRTGCPWGFELAMQENDDLRIYVLKMQHICHSADYQANIDCYQDAIDEDALSRCNPTWNSIQPLLNLTAFNYFCQPQQPPTVALNDALGELAQCHANVVMERCGSAAAEAIRDLITKAFKDPFYLQFKYKPDCKLHSAEVPYDAHLREMERVHNEQSSEQEHDNKHGAKSKEESHSTLHEKHHKQDTADTEKDRQTHHPKDKKYSVREQKENLASASYSICDFSVSLLAFCLLLYTFHSFV